MLTSSVARRERTLELALAFVEEVRRDLERAMAAGSDLPPRIRSVHERVGHATPEYRTFAVQVPPGASGASPEVLSEMIARYATTKAPSCLMLALDAVSDSDADGQKSVLIAEVRDRSGTRLYFVQPFRLGTRGIRWDEPLGGGWRDPGAEEMILDASFAD